MELENLGEFALSRLSEFAGASKLKQLTLAVTLTVSFTTVQAIEL